MNDQSKVALVTGASRGIGAAIAETLGLAGYTAVSYTHLTLPTTPYV